MTSNLKRTLGGMLTLAVVLSATEVRAQSLEKPGAPPSEAAATAPATPSGPATFGDSGQFMLSAERMFGYTYTHQTYGAAPAATGSTFTLLSAPFGDHAGAYSWPRIGFDYFLAKSFSAGGSATVYRNSSGGVGQTGFGVAPRLGYGAKVGPWLDVWPRAGVTYTYATGGGTTLQYLALTVEALAVIEVSSHLLISFGPTLDYGLSGSRKSAGTSVSAKLTDIDVQLGLVVPF